MALALTAVDVAVLSPTAFFFGVIVGLALSSRYHVTRRDSLSSEPHPKRKV